MTIHVLAYLDVVEKQRDEGEMTPRWTKKYRDDRGKYSDKSLMIFGNRWSWKKGNILVMI